MDEFFVNFTYLERSFKIIAAVNNPPYTIMKAKFISILMAGGAFVTDITGAVDSFGLVQYGIEL